MRLKSKKNQDKELKTQLKDSLKRITSGKLLSQSDDIKDKQFVKTARLLKKSKIKSLDELYPRKIKKRRKFKKPIVLIKTFLPRGSSHAKPKRKRRRPKIFVFGSNLAGKHGAGSAKLASKKYGAEYGIGKGRTGMAYAIPTKDRRLRTLPIAKISRYVSKFFHYAYRHQELRFKVVKIGCGLAGYSEREIKPLFKYFRYLTNVRLPKGWKG